MTANTAIKTQSGESPTKNEPENEVETIDYDIKVRCTKSLDGTTRSCKIVEIATDGPTKGQTDIPSIATAAPRKIAAETDGDCDLCSILADSLKDQVRPTAAPRRMHSPLGRRMARS